mgnify:CR=1 FL=1
MYPAILFSNAITGRPVSFAEQDYHCHHYNACGKSNTLLRPHQLYKELGITVEEQLKHYRNQF